MTAPDRPALSDAVLLTRSEEELRLGVIRRPVERLRLRKAVVTEEVTITVPVRREEFRLERLPVSAPDSAAMEPHDPEQAEETLIHEFVLHEEVPVVEMRVVARERVRVLKTRYTEHAEVSEQLRRERIDADGADPHASLGSTPQPGD